MATGPSEKIKLTCPDCNKSYRIRKRQIPAGATAVRCKDCGQLVKLALTPSDSRSIGSPSQATQIQDIPLEKGAVAAPRCRLDLMTEEKRPRPRRKTNRSKKPWAF